MSLPRIVLAACAIGAAGIAASWVGYIPGRPTLEATATRIGLAPTLAALGLTKPEATEEQVKAAPQQAPGGRRQAPQVVSVTAAEAVAKSMPVRTDAIGTVQTIASVVVRTRVDSQLQQVHFKDGDLVKEGQLLFTLDARVIDAQIQEAEARLASAKAALEQAQRDVARYTQLIARDAAAQKSLDDAKTAAAIQNANVQATAAQIANLKVQRDFYTIRAPISGRVGLPGFRQGAVVRAADTTNTLVTINQTSPIYVAFTLPQRLLAETREAMAADTLKLDVTVPGMKTPIAGRVAMLDNQVDPQTGAITIRGQFENADEVLWPGVLVNVRLTLRIEDNVVTVPSPAVMVGQQGNYVFVVKDNVASIRPVTVERTLDGETVLTKGLAGGETVVTDGQLQLTNGTRVEIRRPASDTRPTPTSATDPVKTRG